MPDDRSDSRVPPVDYQIDVDHDILTTMREEGPASIEAGRVVGSDELHRIIDEAFAEQDQTRKITP